MGLVKGTDFAPRTFTPFPANGEGGPTHDRTACHKAAAQFVDDAHLRDVTEAIEKLRLQSHTKHYAAAVISCADVDASRWVRDGIPGFHGVVDEHFVQAARMRLAIPPLVRAEEGGVCGLVRTNGNKCAAISTARHHALACEGRVMAWREKSRHDEMAKLWARAIRKLDGCGGVVTENTWAETADGEKVISDIEFNKSGKQWVLDISLTSPSLPSYSGSASKTPESAAVLRWKAKHKKYWMARHSELAAVTPVADQREPSVVPIVFETSGRLYSESMEWARDVLFRGEKAKLTSLLTATSCLMARRVGEALHEGAVRGLGSAR